MSDTFLKSSFFLLHCGDQLQSCWCVISVHAFHQHCLCVATKTFRVLRGGAYRGRQKRHNAPGGESLSGAEKSQQCRKYFLFVLPKDHRFENGGARLVSCPGPDSTSVRACVAPHDSSYFLWFLYHLWHYVDDVCKSNILYKNWIYTTSQTLTAKSYFTVNSVKTNACQLHVRRLAKHLELWSKQSNLHAFAPLSSPSNSFFSFHHLSQNLMLECVHFFPTAGSLHDYDEWSYSWGTVLSVLLLSCWFCVNTYSTMRYNQSFLCSCVIRAPLRFGPCFCGSSKHNKCECITAIRNVAIQQFEYLIVTEISKWE